MKLESYGYKFLITAMGVTATKGKTFVALHHDEAFQHFCDILDSGCPVGILLYKHGEMLGSAGLAVEQYLSMGREGAWEYAIKYCEMSDVTK